MSGRSPGVELIEGLCSSAAYPHPVDEIRVCETHISWVILTGDFAYKVKKPVALPFLDFSTLERRLHFCQEELRLNRRLAPELYLGVVAVTGSREQPRIGVEAQAIEYAVKMRQFPDGARLDQILESGALSVADLTETAERVALDHQSAPVCEAAAPYGSPESTFAVVEENFETLESHGIDDPALPRLREWFDRNRREVEELVAARKGQGWVRECHGDLHLSNLVRIDGGITAFDCIEFDPGLRWIDTVCDVAFLIMDLEVRGHDDLAYAFLNRYLEVTGDYEGVHLLRFYLVYRDMVRAKIWAIQMRQLDPARGEHAAAVRRVRAHLGHAAQLAEPSRPLLALTSGVSGSGKTWLAGQLVTELPALRLRSDLERKRSAGLGEGAGSRSELGTGLYTPEAKEDTYRRLERLTRVLLESGSNVVVDATFLKRAQRAPFFDLAREYGASAIVVHCDAEVETLRRRVKNRIAEGRDASEATLAVLEAQFGEREPPTAEEEAPSLSVDTGSALDVASIAAQIRRVARVS